MQRQAIFFWDSIRLSPIFSKPSRKEAEEAVKTLIKWAGDNPNREGLRETPKRVAKAIKEFLSKV